MPNPYKTRVGGATVTVFVPYDCQNNCPFCINKQEYRDCSGFSEERIIESIRIMDAISPYCDFVFTGGEPFANLPSLQRMLDAVSMTHRVFINTTFPRQKTHSLQEMCEFVDRNAAHIYCLNISRHIQPYVEESPDPVLDYIVSRKRINCVLEPGTPPDVLRSFVDRFLGYFAFVQFRADYTETTPQNLYDSAHDLIFRDLCTAFVYSGLEGCRMRNGYHFMYKGANLTYHRTLPYSTVTELGENGKVYDILYDIIIKQNGDIHSDWTGVPLDIERYKRSVIEPYDLRVLDGVVNF